MRRSRLLDELAHALARDTPAFRAARSQDRSRASLGGVAALVSAVARDTPAFDRRPAARRAPAPMPVEVVSAPVVARGRWIALTTLAIATSLVAIGGSSVNVALPTIGADLGIAQGDLSWVGNAYLVLAGSLIFLGGRLASAFGSRRMLMVGLTTLAAGAALGALAQTELVLVVARAVQGGATALIAPAALSLIAVLFRAPHERNRALGAWSAAAGLGVVWGPLLGGALTQWCGWRWVLAVDAPIALALVALAPRLLPRVPGNGRLAPVQLAATVLTTAGVGLAVYALAGAGDSGWTSTRTLGCGAAAGAILAALLGLEARAPELIAWPSMRGPRGARGASAVAVAIGAWLFALPFLTSLYLQQVLGIGALAAGAALLLPSLLSVVLGNAASNAMAGLGARPVLLAGQALTTVGLLWFSRISGPGDSYVGAVLGPSLLAGAGLAMSMRAVIIAAIDRVKPTESGTASAWVNTLLNLGGAVGVALLFSIAGTRTRDLLNAGERSSLVAVSHGFRTAFLVGAGISVLTMVVSVVALSSPDKRAGAKASQPSEAMGA